ncbi:MAG: HNH endonuclease [Clostridia bacterium]|nr:HNH endonuclease [Clostridia bacterium]
MLLYNVCLIFILPYAMNVYHSTKYHVSINFEIPNCPSTNFKNSTNQRVNRVNYERKRMSPKLRYEILKRDNFTCVLCGASREDGAVLEVDHIYPISKGGKTERSNLRTLCRDCNRGKGTQYDPYGKN